MITARSIYKFRGVGKRHNKILKDVDFSLKPGASAIIYGLPGSGKTTFLRILAGLSTPNAGKVLRHGVVSVPIASMGLLRLGDTAAHICYVLGSVYGLDKRGLADFIENFADLHGWMDAKTELLANDKRTRLVYGLGYAIPADLYLVDGQPFRGNDSFAAKCRQAFEQRKRFASFLCVTSDLDPNTIEGAIGGILHDGKIRTFPTAVEAAQVYSSLQAEYAADIIEHIRGLIRSGNRDEAKPLLDDVLRDEPTNAAAIEMLGKMAWQDNDFPRVVALSDIVNRPEPQDAELLMMSARASERTGDYKRAIDSGRAVLTLDPTNAKAAALVAKCCESRGDYAAAATLWLDLAKEKICPELLAAARCLDLAQDWETLHELVQKLLDGPVPPAKKYILLGIKAALGCAKPQAAITLVEHLIKVEPDRVFSILTVYRQDLGPIIVSRILNDIRATGFNFDEELRNRDNISNFLRRSRREAAKTLSSEDLSSLDDALATLKRRDEANQDIKVIPSPAG